MFKIWLNPGSNLTIFRETGPRSIVSIWYRAHNQANGFSKKGGINSRDNRGKLLLDNYLGLVDSAWKAVHNPASPIRYLSLKRIVLLLLEITKKILCWPASKI